MFKLCVLLGTVTAYSAAGSPFLSADLPITALDFHETFDEKSGGLFTSGKWIKSSVPKYKHQPVMVKQALNAPPGFEKDKGLQLTQEMKYYGVSTPLRRPLAPTGGDVVFQYEVKFDVFTCGGAYLKFLRASEDLDLKQLDDQTPFSVMFGPDRCGNDNKVHFIMQHQSPKTFKWEEKHFASPPAVVVDKLTHLYTLAVHGADNSFDIYIDKRQVASGNLHTDMDPPINPPLEVDDPADEKPADWVDEQTIPDPDAVKPEDWDETQPMMIQDTTKTMPAGWREDWALVVPDPTAEMPEDWDEEEDGEWEAPEVPNPGCESVPGCGPWTPPMKKNPEYKGKWVPPIIPNPAYIGEWTPRQIPNENYFEEEHPAHLAPIAAVAVEVWTTNAGIHYDNIIVAHSLDDAWAFADASFALKHEAELEKQRQDEAAELERIQRERMAEGGIGAVVEVYITKVIQYLENSPHVRLVINRILASFSGFGFLSPEALSWVEQNATSIIIGFTVVVSICFVFLFCACVMPSSQAPSDEDDVEEMVKDGPAGESSMSGNEADAEVEVADSDGGEVSHSASGIRQRTNKKKSRKDS